MQTHPPRSGGELVRFENVGLRYGTAHETLTDISFSIHAQSFQFLTGASGSGKTTILRLILQSLKPTRGVISIFGQDTTALDQDGLTALRRRMGIVFQDFRLLDHLTVYENVALPFKIRGRFESSFRKEVIELLRWIGLGELADARPPVLSGGEKQRVSIARALVSQPELLLADEPTGNLDPVLAARLLRLFVELNRTGTAILIATHDIGLMDQIQGARRLILQKHHLQIEEAS